MTTNLDHGPRNSYLYISSHILVVPLLPSLLSDYLLFFLPPPPTLSPPSSVSANALAFLLHLKKKKKSKNGNNQKRMFTDPYHGNPPPRICTPVICLFPFRCRSHTVLKGQSSHEHQIPSPSPAYFSFLY